MKPPECGDSQEPKKCLSQGVVEVISKCLCSKYAKSRVRLIKLVRFMGCLV